MRFVCFALIVILGACATVLTRNPAPEAELDTAAPYGIRPTEGQFRVWGDVFDAETSQAVLDTWVRTLRETRVDEIASGGPVVETTLALSGGGPDGAFGAGLLKGWTDRGDRPEFDIVTGISTGAILAVFAFLGSDYDETLTEIYTAYSTENLIEPTLLTGLTGGAALFDARGFRGLIEQYIDDEVMQRIAEEHERGRELLIGTTNLDAARPVVWGLGRIARTGHPDAKRLVHDVIQASSAIPAVFPPTIIPVETPDGRRFDELHVDGGATQQVMFFSPSLPMRRVDDALGVPVDRTVFVVINNKVEKPYSPVRPRAMSIAGTAVTSLLGGAGTSDVYKIYTLAQRDDMKLRMTSVPRDFDVEAEEVFDPAYMKALYELGYAQGLASDKWTDRPPFLVPYP